MDRFPRGAPGTGLPSLPRPAFELSLVSLDSIEANTAFEVSYRLNDALLSHLLPGGRENGGVAVGQGGGGSSRAEYRPS